MSSKKRLNRIEQLQREEEILTSPVRMDGKGEDPVVQALLSDDFVQASNSKALDIALALQVIVRGQNAILEQLQGQGESITRLQEKMIQYDKAAKKWEEDKQGFIEGVQERAEALKITNPEERAKLMAREGQRVQREIQMAVANKATSELEFRQWMENQPKVTVTSPGKLVTVNQGGVLQTVVEAEVIRIKTLEWVLSPGIPTDVPQPVAEEFYSRQRIQNETIERKKILNADRPLDNVVMAQEWNGINKKYGSHTDTMLADDR